MFQFFGRNHPFWAEIREKCVNLRNSPDSGRVDRSTSVQFVPAAAAAATARVESSHPARPFERLHYMKRGCWLAVGGERPGLNEMLDTDLVAAALPPDQ